MSRYKRFQVDRIRDHPLSQRKSKVSTADFARPLSADSFSAFVDSLPRILAGRDLRLLADRICRARSRRRAIIWGFGGHLVKVGLSPVMIGLMEKGFVSALATNGSGLIHDFEIALCGATSEDVERELQDGSFGMARETGEQINLAINRGAAEGKGIGESVGEFLLQSEPGFADCSLLVQAHRMGIPLTVHVALGTDIVHNHPAASGQAIGCAGQVDYQIFAQQVSELNDGGVYLNIGSAVILPEVFLKALTLVRNSGRACRDFTTANLDFIQHYRPLQNVVKRPVTPSGLGISLTGHHEIMVPLLAAMLVQEA